MMRRGKTGVLALALLTMFSAPAFALSADELASRFFPAPAAAPIPPELALPPLPTPDDGNPDDVDRHNEGVRYNNDGIRALDDGKIEEAIQLFQRATAADPHEKGSWSNLIIALQRGGSRPREMCETALQLMARDGRDYHAPYAAGITLLDKLKQPREAIPFLEEALRRNADDPALAVALAQAWEKAGFPDRALELLKTAAPLIKDDPYPQYLLGNLLLAKRDYVPAIRAYQSVLDRDREGYVHDAWLRARYYAGQIDGLAEAIDAALRRFPGIMNRQVLERIAFSLGDRRYRLVETVNVQVGDPTALQKLDFIIRLPPQIAGFQKVLVEKVSIVADGRESDVELAAPDADGRVRIKGVEGIRNGLVKLKIVYDIERRAWLGSRGPFQPVSDPDMEELKRDERLSLENAGLDALDRRLRREDGNFLQNAYLAIGRGLTYRENFEEHGVDWALANPDACDCTEFSWLLTALCIRRGLPARVVTGFLVKSELIGKETNIGHAWVDVYFQGKGWVPADPTLGTTMQWAYFGNLLSDQIVFDYFEPSRKSRVSIDFTSTRATMPVTITNTYLITVRS